MYTLEIPTSANTNKQSRLENSRLMDIVARTTTRRRGHAQSSKSCNLRNVVMNGPKGPNGTHRVLTPMYECSTTKEDLTQYLWAREKRTRKPPFFFYETCGLHPCHWNIIRYDAIHKNERVFITPIAGRTQKRSRVEGSTQDTEGNGHPHLAPHKLRRRSVPIRAITPPALVPPPILTFPLTLVVPVVCQLCSLSSPRLRSTCDCTYTKYNTPKPARGPSWFLTH
ncbi:hypothetical protein J1N35_010998 [Gossypium stocksii]|uniref:Uncharacterized protein n=1 Tax=Gossypium stocksii TaxID=47602 RepID=A0A9D3W3M5_9ROSI|nr:hypothetical protein J1N35_010998 [Gossypium stocksii]